MRKGGVAFVADEEGKGEKWRPIARVASERKAQVGNAKFYFDDPPAQRESSSAKKGNGGNRRQSPGPPIRRRRSAGDVAKKQCDLSVPYCSILNLGRSPETNRQDPRQPRRRSSVGPEPKGSKDDKQRKGSKATANDGEKEKYSDIARKEEWLDIELIDAIERDIVDHVCVV